ncbi:hypothetical protein ACSMXM_15635 [Pacificimonas sp. ICDLI1SI03]
MSFASSTEVREMIGDAGFRRLVEHHAGREIYVPFEGSTSDAAKRFERIMGDDAPALQEAFAGTHIRVPRRLGPARVEVPRLAAAGLSLNEVAERLDISFVTAAKFYPIPVRNPGVSTT